MSRAREVGVGLAAAPALVAVTARRGFLTGLTRFFAGLRFFGAAGLSRDVMNPDRAEAAPLRTRLSALVRVRLNTVCM